MYVHRQGNKPEWLEAKIRNIVPQSVIPQSQYMDLSLIIITNGFMMQPPLWIIALISRVQWIADILFPVPDRDWRADTINYLFLSLGMGTRNIMNFIGNDSHKIVLNNIYVISENI